jgi:hypothetical protein
MSTRKQLVAASTAATTKKSLVDKCVGSHPLLSCPLSDTRTSWLAAWTRATQLAKALSTSHYALPGAQRPGAWRIDAATLVAAPTPPVPGLIQLGLVDTELYMVGGPCNGAMFFNSALDSDMLKEALAASLEAFPILAGRVVSLPPPGQPPRSNKGQWRRGFPRAVECNNAGAVRVQHPSSVGWTSDACDASRVSRCSAARMCSCPRTGAAGTACPRSPPCGKGSTCLR